MPRNGFRHCGKVWEARDLDAEIVSDPTASRLSSGGKWVSGDLVWIFRCPEDGAELSREPFAYPPDMPSTE